MQLIGLVDILVFVGFVAVVLFTGLYHRVRILHPKSKRLLDNQVLLVFGDLDPYLGMST